MVVTQIVVLTLSVVLIEANVYPSSRIVYYLHTTPASWVGARDSCNRYGGHLVKVVESDDLRADIITVDTFLEWKGAYSSLTSDVWTGLHKYLDTNTSSEQLLWHSCDTFSPLTDTNSGIGASLRASPHYCTSMDHDYKLQATNCTKELPYICQIDEGQCWFLPLENKEFKINATQSNTTEGLNACAQTCRNFVSAAGVECWGFVVINNTCEIYNSDKRHAYIRDLPTYITNANDKVAYLKICTGGEPTTMKALNRNVVVKPDAENCTKPADGAAWDSGVCYCDCDQPPVILAPEYLSMSVEEKVQKAVEGLKVDSKNTSAAFMKLNSIEDHRPSAQSLGGVGIGILCFVFGGLILLDMNVLIAHVIKLLGKLKPAEIAEESKE